jgi:hypothetical protein
MGRNSSGPVSSGSSWAARGRIQSIRAKTGIIPALRIIILFPQLIFKKNF